MIFSRTSLAALIERKRGIVNSTDAALSNRLVEDMPSSERTDVGDAGYRVVSISIASKDVWVFAVRRRLSLIWKAYRAHSIMSFITLASGPSSRERGGTPPCDSLDLGVELPEVVPLLAPFRSSSSTVATPFVLLRASTSSPAGVRLISAPPTPVHIHRFLLGGLGDRGERTGESQGACM